MQFEEPVYRPPMEAESMLLPVMQSCTWNKCNFCYRLKDYPLLVAKPADLRAEIIRQRPFFGQVPNIFLIGSDAFAISARKLLEYLRIVHEELPQTGTISMFSRVDAIRNKTDEELNNLAKAGVTQLYVGTENGNDAALALMNKGHTAKESLEQLKRLDQAGIHYTLFYILGMGGKGAGIQCGIDTARLFNEASPVRIVSTGMTLTAGTGAAQLEKNGQFQQASEREKIGELRAFLENLKIDTFYDGVHFLNPVHFRFRTGDAKTKKQVLAQIDKVLDTYSDSELEQAIDRAAMAKASGPCVRSR